MSDAPDLFVTGGLVSDGEPVAAALDSGLPGASVLVTNPAAGFGLCLNASEVAAITGFTPDLNVKEKLYWIPDGASYLPVSLLNHAAVIAHGIEIAVDFCAASVIVGADSTILRPALNYNATTATVGADSTMLAAGTAALEAAAAAGADA